MNNKIKFKKNLIFKRVIFLIMLVITFCIIFGFSSQDGEKSGALSRKVTEVILNVISGIKGLDIDEKLYYIEKLNPFIRKLAHFSIYSIVGLSIMGVMCTFEVRNTIKVVISVFVGVVYAVIDEIHQSFIPDRGPSVIDVLIDTGGVFVGILAMIVIIVFIGSVKERLIKRTK